MDDDTTATTTDAPATAGATLEAETQPEAFRAVSLLNSITVKDVDKSLAWYHEVVGFSVDYKQERDGKLRSVALRAGDVRILLNLDDGGRGWDRVKGEGISLTFMTDQSVDDVADRIRRLGGTLASEPADMPWGARMFRLVDPDGYRVSISSVPK